MVVPDPMKRRDVAEPDHRFGVCPEGLYVDASQQPQAAASTPQTHDRPHLRIADCIVEVGQAFLVRARKKADFAKCVGANNGPETPDSTTACTCSTSSGSSQLAGATSAMQSPSTNSRGRRTDSMHASQHLASLVRTRDTG